jgi:hypothetical protein
VSSVSVERRRSYHEVTVHADVTGAEPREQGYTKNRRYRPTRLTVRYMRANDSDWRASWELSGPVVKKDGSDGTARGRSVYGDEAPEWVLTFIGENRPEAHR